MKKIVNGIKKGLNWYLNALVNTGAMCPSGMIPADGMVFLYKEKLNKVGKAA